MHSRFFLLVLAASTALAAPAPSGSSLRLGVELYGNGAQSEETQSRIAGTEIQAAYRSPLAPQLEARLAGALQLETGAARVRWTQDFQPRQIQRLQEARLLWSPGAAWLVAIGAHDQRDWQTSLLMGRQTFPALYERFRVLSGKFAFSIEAQQAIPTDTSSLQPWGQWTRGMPAFYLERATLEYSDGRFEARLHVGHFLFENLSAPSAYQAQFMGNTTTGMGADITYRYGFQGFEFGTALRTRLGSVSPFTSASLVENGAAVHGTGWRWVVGADWDASPRFRLSPQVEWFRNEADTAPAFYSDRDFGRANRAGFGVRVAAQWPLSGVGAEARWAHAGVLNANRFQSELDWFQVLVSAQHDVF